MLDNDLLLFEYEPPIPGAGEESGGFAANVQVMPLHRRPLSPKSKGSRRDHDSASYIIRIYY